MCDERNTFFFILIFTVACRLANCERFFARCEITETGLAQCICPEVEDCPVEDDEVCASDKKTYATECHMRVQACAETTPLRVEKEGPCGMCFNRSLLIRNGNV